MFYFIIDILGTIAFAISGVLVAMDKRLDVFGVLIIAFVTAVGGGTLRDLLIGIKPVGWLNAPVHLLIIVVTVLLAIIFVKQLKYVRKSLFLFDTIGIASFTILGVQKAILLNTPIEVGVMLGVMTATFGGVIRDILCTEIPLIFRKEIYATACFVGAISYALLNHFQVNDIVNSISSGLIIVTIRTISVIKKLSLPVINDKF